VRMLLGVAIGTILMTDMVAAQPEPLTLGQAVQQSVEKCRLRDAFCQKTRRLM